MSDFAAVPTADETQSDERPSMGREIAREATVNIAANAAGVLGFAAGVVILGKTVDWARARKARKNQTPETPTQVTETPES